MDVEAIKIFEEVIGKKLKPLIVCYDPYTDHFEVYPYRHIIVSDFEKQFVDILFDTIIFYAYEKSEIEKEYAKGHLDDLRKASRIAYEARVPKTERESDGLMGELALDSLIKMFFPNIELLYSRAKYMDKIPHKEKEPKRQGYEIKGYDGLLFSNEDGKKYFWAGQAKTGEWKYCLDSIKEDINKSIISYYFADSIVIMCDIMRAASNTSSELMQIIDEINDIIFYCNEDRDKKTQLIIEYFKRNSITVRIPCLLMPNETDYIDEEELRENIYKKVHEAFSDFNITNPEHINIEVLLLVFPLRDIKEVRRLFLEVRRP